LIVSGNVFRGVFVIAVFLIFVAQIDTVLRPRLLPKGAQLNPGLVILIKRLLVRSVSSLSPAAAHTFA
jgi:predicted PurR-regulated permease PerM